MMQFLYLFGLSLIYGDRGQSQNIAKSASNIKYGKTYVDIKLSGVDRMK